MKKPLPPIAKKLLFIPPVIAGLLFLAWMIRNQSEPERASEQEVARILRVIHAPEPEIVPRALGYGTAQAGNVWQAVSEVEGRVTFVHPDLQPGAVINKDAVVIKLDQNEYKLAIARNESEIDQAKAELDELTAQGINHHASLKIERASLALAEKELDRIRSLAKQNVASASTLDQQQRAVLTQRQSMQSLTNSLNLIPSQRRVIEAGIAAKQAQLAQAQLDLKKTVIAAPFDCRVGPVSIEVDQFLATGQTLFESHNVDLIEVEAHVAPREVRNLLQQPDARKLLTLDMETMRNVFKLDAIVRFGLGEIQVQWPARFARVRENLDPETRTLGIVVAIDDPYREAIPGQLPPPLPGTFCEVEFRAQKRIRKVIVPRTALHDGHVYVIGADNRLERRPVEIAFMQSEFVAIASGLRSDEIVIVSDPTPAVEGMLVQGVDDGELRQRLVAAATGHGAVR